MEKQINTPEIIIDNNVSGQYINDIPVKKADDIDNWKEYLIVITTNFYDEIEKQLQSYGLNEGNDYIKWTDIAYKVIKDSDFKHLDFFWNLK